MRRDLLSAPFDQGAAGTTSVVAAVPGKRIVVTGYTIALSVAGTYKWQSAANDRTGAIPVGTVPAPDNGTWDTPLFRCGENEALNLVTATGAGKGYVTYYLA